MCQFFDVMVLALLQGIAEFLPISSSGHLVIAQSLLKINNPGMRLEVVLHLGTMVSIMLYYRATLASLMWGFFRFERESMKMVGNVLLSAIPAAFFYFLCKDKVDAFFEDPAAIGGFLIFTGVVLCALRWMRCGEGPVSAPRALLVGLAQALAVLPGISRSGMTIAAARMSGISPDKSAEFSFLMCLPLLAGAAFLDIFGISPGTACAVPGWMLLAGAAVSAVVGFVSLAVLVKTLRGGRFWMFGLYCILAGFLSLLFV